MTGRARESSASDRMRGAPSENGFPPRELIAAYCRHHHLTPREHQVVHLVCEGKKNSAIAASLTLSGATVALHLTNVHRKTATACKVELVLDLWKWSR